MAHPDLAKLEAIAREGRVQILRMLTHAGSGHPGGSLSAIDILTTLYFNRLRYDAKRPEWEDRDRFILSKGHCVPAQYYCMAKAGYFPMERVVTLRKLGSPLQGHPHRVMLPGIEVATGSLGQGLSIAMGLAVGLMSAPKLGAPNHHLDNLCVIVDYNGIQLDSFVKKILDLEPLVDKLKAFGWPVLDINGHDIGQVDKALDEAETIKGAPTFIVAHTVKGKGVSFMENDPEWHGKAPKPIEAIEAIRQIVGEPVPAWVEPIIGELQALEKK